jgi:hypothetical protein
LKIPLVKGASAVSPDAPVITPMTILPTSTKTEPLKNASRSNSPQPWACPSSVVAKRRASSTPTTIAGDSMSAIAATIQPLDGIWSWLSSATAVMNVTALTEP